MMKKLKIGMVHDVVCSWCPIGYSHIQKALRNLKVKADFHFLPYEINPGMGAEGEAIDAYFKRRNQWDNSRLLDYQKNLLVVAESADVTIDFSRRTHYYNSGKAHQLMHWAEGYNQQQPLNELLIEAYFKRGLDISNTLILLDLVEQLGLDSSQAEQVLNSSAVNPQLLRKKQRVQQLALSSIPAFIINESTLIFGSNSVDYFEQALASLLEQDSDSLDIETNPS
jgi:predicted DsbA family dithiol-disulfide isomerase